MQNPVELTFSIKDISRQIFQLLEWSDIESSLVVSKLFLETINWTLFQKYKQNNPDDTEVKSEFFLERLFKISKRGGLLDGIFQGFYTIKEAEDCFHFLGKSSLKNTETSLENCVIFLKLTNLKILSEKSQKWKAILEKQYVKPTLYKSTVSLLLQHVLEKNPDEILSENISSVITECKKYGGFKYPLKKIFYDQKCLNQLREIKLPKLLALCTYPETYIRQLLNEMTPEQINTIKHKTILSRGYDLSLITSHSEENIALLDLSAQKVAKMLCCLNELINHMMSESWQKTGVGHPFVYELKNWLPILHNNKKVKATCALPKRIAEWLKQIQEQPIFSAILQLQFHNKISCEVESILFIQSISWNIKKIDPLLNRYSIRNNPVCLYGLFEEFLKIEDLENKSAEELLMILKNTEEQLRGILEKLQKKLEEKNAPGFFYGLGWRLIAPGSGTAEREKRGEQALYERYQGYIKQIKDCLEKLYPLEEGFVVIKQIEFQ